MRDNIKCACGMWSRIRMVLEEEEVPDRVNRIFYYAVIAPVLLFGS